MALSRSEMPLAFLVTVAITGVRPRPLAVSITVHIVTLIGFIPAEPSLHGLNRLWEYLQMKSKSRCLL